MKNDELEISDKFIRSIRNIVQSDLDTDSIDAVNHYLEYGEYEMALEGLFIEIMKLGRKPEIDYQKVIHVGKTLDLDKESVFDGAFWFKLFHYIEKG